MQANEEQQKAIEKIEGQLLIIAGAGSGKTATLTTRVEYMIREKNIAPNSILMVTFTNKAATEMRERVAKTLGVNTPRNLFSSYNFPLIGTFHSIGILFLKQNLDKDKSNYLEISSKLNLKKDFIIYDETDKLSILKNIIKDKLSLDEKQYPARQIASYISNAKNGLITAAAYEKEIDNQMKEVVFQVYTKYEQSLKQNNAIDFDDILIKTLSLLQIPEVSENYQEIYKYLMVDEYQDTNLVQYNIVKLLASKYKNLAVVGDDYQSIYSWRGADIRNILNFKKDYPEALTIKLEQNYRSTGHILTGANSVIANNKTGMKKELWTQSGLGEKINLIDAPDDRLEAKIIVNIIKQKEGNYSDNLILYRTNAQSRAFEEALLVNGIPYRVVGGMKFYDRKEIKDLISYLKVIFNPDDMISFKRIVNTPTRKIGDKSIETLDIYRENFGLSYIQILENLDDVDGLKPAGKKALTDFFELYKFLKEQSELLEVSKLLQTIVDKTGYIEYLTEGLTDEEKTSKKENIDELINVASEYNGMEPKDGLSTFLEEIALISDLDTKDERSDFVTLMTIHTSKGLEQNRVFIGGLEEGIFPSFRTFTDINALEEERRLMYVAMTRAKKELYISKARQRFQFGEFVSNKESRFLKEIDENVIFEYDNKEVLGDSRSFFGNNFSSSFSDIGNGESIIKQKIKVENNDISIFAKGDKIAHHKFGNGLIVDLKGEIAEIAFSGKGIMKMNIKIAPIKKL